MRFAILCLTSLLLAPKYLDAATIYIPVVAAPGTRMPSDVWPWQSIEWCTTRAVTNTTNGPLAFRYISVLGGEYARIEPGCSEGPLIVPPRATWHVAPLGSLGCVSPGNGAGFVELDVDPGVIVSGSIHLEAFRACEPSPPPVAVSLATAPLPVYEVPFPAGMTAHSASIPPPPSETFCSDPADPASRRINLTVANTGDAEAMATVWVPGDSPDPYVFSVPARRSVQLNGVLPGHAYEILLLSATQPYLAYASSVTTYLDPRRPPDLAVYPFRLLR